MCFHGLRELCWMCKGRSCCRCFWLVSFRMLIIEFLWNFLDSRCKSSSMELLKAFKWVLRFLKKILDICVDFSILEPFKATIGNLFMVFHSFLLSTLKLQRIFFNCPRTFLNYFVFFKTLNKLQSERHSANRIHAIIPFPIKLDLFTSQSTSLISSTTLQLKQSSLKKMRNSIANLKKFLLHSWSITLYLFR